MKHKIFSLVILTTILLNCLYTQREDDKRITLIRVQGTMHFNVVVNENDGKDIFALTIPETIGCREGMVLNFPSTNIQWNGPDKDGVISVAWTTDSLISYYLIVVPEYDFVDVEMTISNLSAVSWHDVWSFNCLNPVSAKKFQDTLLRRTFMSTKNGPEILSKTNRTIGPRPTIGVYFHEETNNQTDFPFVNDFQATSPDRTNSNYLVTLSETKNSYMAVTSPKTLFLFNNLEYKCIHSAPNFGDIDSGKSSTLTCRFYFAKGNLQDFINRFKKEIDLLQN